MGTGLIMAIKVSIIEDDDWIRENLASRIAQTEGFVCVGAYQTVKKLYATFPPRRRTLSSWTSTCRR